MADEKSEEAAEEKEQITIKIPKLKMPKNLWMISTFVLLAFILVLIAYPQLFGGMQATGQAAAVGGLTEQQAADKAVDYLRDMDYDCTLVSVEEFENPSLYEVMTSIQGKNVPVYVTKDGRFVFSLIGDTTTPVTTTTTTTTQPQELNIEEEDLKEFIGCLKDSGFKIYGANWCGWTNKLVTMLGGFDMVEPIYVECTEQKEECDNAGVTGYPTIIINEEMYQGERTFKALSDATGCEIPPGAEVEQSNPSPNESGGC